MGFIAKLDPIFQGYSDAASDYISIPPDSSSTTSTTLLDTTTTTTPHIAPTDVELQACCLDNNALIGLLVAICIYVVFDLLYKLVLLAKRLYQCCNKTTKYDCETGAITATSPQDCFGGVDSSSNGSFVTAHNQRTPGTNMTATPYISTPLPLTQGR